MSVALPLLPPPQLTGPEAMNSNTGVPSLIQRSIVALTQLHHLLQQATDILADLHSLYLIHTEQVDPHFHRPFPPLPTPPPRPLPIPSSASFCDTPPPRPRSSPPIPDPPSTPNTPSPSPPPRRRKPSKRPDPFPVMQTGMTGTQTPNVVLWNPRPIYTYDRTGHMSPGELDSHWNSAKLVGMTSKTFNASWTNSHPRFLHRLRSPALQHSPTTLLDHPHTSISLNRISPPPHYLITLHIRPQWNLLLLLRGRPLTPVMLNNPQMRVSAFIFCEFVSPQLPRRASRKTLRDFLTICQYFGFHVLFIGFRNTIPWMLSIICHQSEQTLTFSPCFKYLCFEYFFT